jgi:formyltetrahydrofolate synthetase
LWPGAEKHGAMPGLWEKPASRKVDIDADGNIVALG